MYILSIHKMNDTNIQALFIENTIDFCEKKEGELLLFAWNNRIEKGLLVF